MKSKLPILFTILTLAVVACTKATKDAPAPVPVASPQIQIGNPTTGNAPIVTPPPPQAQNQGGIDGSGGGSLRQESGSAWFVGTEKVIKTCLKVSPDFGVEAAKIKTIIQRVFEAWHTYAIDKNVDHFSYRLNFSEVCGGKEDLTFYLGVDTPEISQEKMHYDRPIAFNIRATYDFDNGWSKGLIWLANSGSVDSQEKYPDYRDEKRLYGILLHEVGHLFGNAHVAGTIMDFNINMDMHSNFPADHRLEQIDQTTELAHCSACDKKYSGILGSPYEVNLKTGTNLELLNKNYQLLVGVPPKGAITTDLAVHRGTYLDAVILHVKDESSESYEFPIQLLGQYCPSGGLDSVFKFVIRVNDGSISTYRGDGRSCIRTGLLKTRTGQMLNVSIMENITSGVQVYLKIIYSNPTSSQEEILFSLLPME